MSKEIDFQNLIADELVKKTCDLIICIPTFNSYEVTKATIQSFYDQEGVEKDILITGPSGDIEKLKAFYPDINYVLTKDNYGSSGNQLINIFMAKKYNYEFIMLNDNDARLVDNESLGILMKNLKKNNLLVTFPIPTSKKYEDELEKCDFCAFHCCLYSLEIFKKIDFHFDFNYFLFFDDVSFLIKLKNYKDKVKASKVYCIHPENPLKFFEYKTMFLFTRSYFNFMFNEKLPLDQKIYYLFLYRPHALIPMFFLYSIINFDFTYFSMFFSALSQVIMKDFKLINFPKPRIKYDKVCFPSNIDEYKNFNLLTDVVFPKPKFKFLNENSEYVYLKQYR